MSSHTWPVTQNGSTYQTCHPITVMTYLVSDTKLEHLSDSLAWLTWTATQNWSTWQQSSSSQPPCCCSCDKWWSCPSHASRQSSLPTPLNPWLWLSVAVFCNLSDDKQLNREEQHCFKPDNISNDNSRNRFHFVAVLLTSHNLTDSTCWGTIFHRECACLWKTSQQSLLETKQPLF